MRRPRFRSQRGAKTALVAWRRDAVRARAAILEAHAAQGQRGAAAARTKRCNPFRLMPPATTERDLAKLIAPLLADPSAAAVLSDIDGTLAPISSDPQQVAVPDGARAALAELSGRFAVVGCISGRR